MASLPNFGKYDKFCLISSHRHSFGTPAKDIIRIYNFSLMVALSVQLNKMALTYPRDSSKSLM